jgi:hypothetical protein
MLQVTSNGVAEELVLDGSNDGNSWVKFDPRENSDDFNDCEDSVTAKFQLFESEES